jgi:hypothetical protein
MANRYLKRTIDYELLAWKNDKKHKANIRETCHFKIVFATLYLLKSMRAELEMVDILLVIM